MEGVILHSGAGTRLLPLTFIGPKQLIPVANKPIASTCWRIFRSIGVIDVDFLGETFPELFQQHHGDGSRFRVRISYARQGNPLGIA
ncbi:MAG: hypothetical protein FGF48_05130 [Candidatus Brockarchaeota archaeon]|nr:hypothetical protein [Candidatus Brockarchaeota archaeon]